MEHATDFLSALLHTVPDDLYTYLWAKHASDEAQKRTHWWQVGRGSGGLADLATKLAADNDVYVAVSVARRADDEFHRLTAEKSAGLMGFWADIDIADSDIHKKFNLPPTQDDALDILTRSGLPPTAVIHSGHGLQAWWLFDEFMSFDTDSERIEAAQLAQRWNTTLRVRAAERSWIVDSVYDLARVMRVPGTHNHKDTDAVADVMLLSLDESKRYSVSDFEAHLVDERVVAELGLNLSRSYIVGELDLVATAEPAVTKMDVLGEVEPRFKASLERTRRDMKDQTGSSYDLSLATYAAQAGWSDQEIADLLIYARRKHNDNPEKCLRRDYMARTISKAREKVAVVIATESMEESVEQLVEARTQGDDEEVRTARRNTMDALSQQFGLEIIHFIRYTADPPAYAMVTPAHVVQLGNPHEMLRLENFRACCFGVTGHLIPSFAKPQWDVICAAIGKSVEDQDTGIESTEAGSVYTWLSEFLDQHPPVDDVDEAIAMEFPFKDEAGAVHVHGPRFRSWLMLGRGERNVTARHMGRMLRSYGCTTKTLNVKVDGKRSTREFWILPASFGKGDGPPVVAPAEAPVDNEALQ